MVVCSQWNMSYSGGVSWVLTKQRNRGSEVQGAAETVVVGQRRQNSGVDVAGSTQGANCNFESTGVLGMSHRRCMREESGGNSPERKDSPAVRVVGGEDERGTHRGCTATTAKSPEPGKMAELWAFCAWGVFSWTWNAMWEKEWSGGSERERWLVHSLCSLGIHWAWGTVDAVRGEWEAVMWVPGGVGPTNSERNSKIALEAKSKWVACQGSLEGTQGGFCAARNLG
uniref:Uncharacterized protein n=1 Tax=Oryza punctata TaxID=4537 RepID=A0A0E0LVE8_ORYPU